MFYNQKDKSAFGSQDSLRLSNSPNSVYSTTFSRSSTPSNSSQTPGSSTNNTPLTFKEKFEALPHVVIDDSSEMEKYIDDLTESPTQNRLMFGRNSSLSIDIGTANGGKVPNPIRSAFATTSAATLQMQSQKTEPLWGSSFTPTADFFGKQISEKSSMNAPQMPMKSPMLSSFSKYSLAAPAPNIDVFSPSRHQFFASTPRTATFEPSTPAMPVMPSTPNLSSVMKYFSKSEDSQISQLSLEQLNNLNYGQILSRGQLPKIVLPGSREQSLGNDLQLVLVAFKNGRLDIFYYALQQYGTVAQSLKVGDLVVVEADRGRDLGEVVLVDISIDDARVIKMLQYEEQNDALKFDHANGMDEKVAPPQPHTPKQVLKIAAGNEVAQIPNKESDELKAMQVMESKLAIHKVPMRVLGAEYQFDRRKLTFYYVANKRIDFRDLVKDIFRIYKTRIWMCAVKPMDIQMKRDLEYKHEPVQQEYTFTLGNTNTIHNGNSNMNTNTGAIGNLNGCQPMSAASAKFNLGAGAQWNNGW